MSRPADWILAFRNTIDNTLTASLAKLKEVFDEGYRLVEDQKARLKAEQEEQAKEAELARAAKLAKVAAGAAVKKPRGRPANKEKLKSTLSTAVTLVFPAKFNVGLTLKQQSETEVSLVIEPTVPAVIVDENVAPVENSVLVEEKKAEPAVMTPVKQSRPAAPAKKPRGRPRKNLESDVSSLSASVESLPVFAAEEIVVAPVAEPVEKAPLTAELLLPVPEPVYILAKPELLAGPAAPVPAPVPPSPVIRAAMTPSKPAVSHVEIEITNPPGSHLKPRQSLRRVSLPVEPSPAKPAAVAAVKEATPKIESWTNQFLKAAPPPPPPVPAVIVEPVVVEEPIKAPEPHPIPKANPALAHLQAESAATVESPLTRARRIDSQNTWREQQLSKFFVSKTEVLKNAMDTLKVVKAEERTSKMFVERRETTVVSARETIVPAREPEVVKPAEPVEVAQSPTKVASPAQVRPKSPFVPILPKPALSLSPKARDYQDVFKVASPLKTKKETLVFTSGPASPQFLASFEAPLLDDTAIPDELAFPELVQATTVEASIPMKREPSVVPPGISEEERIKRQRLKERQMQAIEKRNAQIKKAQETRQKQEEMFNPKPRVPMPLSKASGMHTANPTRTPAAPGQAKGQSISGLHKAAIFNASKSNLSNVGGAEKPDFKTPAAKIRSPGGPIKMAEKVVSSPILPEIHSDDEDYLRKAADARRRPDWAVTPALKAALLDQQQNCPADKIFDKIQPVRLEDIFKNKTFKRGRNSTIPFM